MTPLQQAVSDFVNFAKGEELHFPGCPGTQCMCIPHWYVLFCFGIKEKTFLAQPLARLVWENFDNLPAREYFDKIPNTPTNFPLIGDIPIFGAPIGAYKDGNGQVAYAGHIVLSIEDGNPNTFTSLDENWGATPTVATVVNHDYTGIENADPTKNFGWLRPNAKLLALLTTNASQVQQQLQTEIQAVTDCQTQLTKANSTLTTQQNRIDELANQVVDLQKDKEALQLQYANTHAENGKLLAEVAAFTNERLNYAQEADKTKAAAAQLTEYLDTIAAHAGVGFRGQTDDKITSSVMLVLSQQQQKINDLTSQLKRYNDIKQAIDPITKPGFWKYIKSIFVTQR